MIKDVYQSYITVVGNLYHVVYGQPKDYVHTVTDSLSEINASKEDLWHCRYGHVGVEN